MAAEEEKKGSSVWAEIAKIVFPVLLAWGISYITAQNAAEQRVNADLAVIRNTEELHFQEIQRRLDEANAWLLRIEAARKGK